MLRWLFRKQSAYVPSTPRPTPVVSGERLIRLAYDALHNRPYDMEFTATPYLLRDLDERITRLEDPSLVQVDP